MTKVDGAQADIDTAKEFVFSFENVGKDVSISQSGCKVTEDVLVLIDNRPSVSARPKWFGK